MGWYAVCDILFPHHIGIGIPEWTIHTATSGCVAYHIWRVRHVPAAIGIPNVPKLSKHHGHYLLVRSETEKFPYRYG